MTAEDRRRAKSWRREHRENKGQNTEAKRLAENDKIREARELGRLDPGLVEHASALGLRGLLPGGRR